MRKYSPLGWGELAVAGFAAVLRVLLTGLPVGVGNQALHIVFIEFLRDPLLFHGDLLVETLPRFPTWFFHMN